MFPQDLLRILRQMRETAPEFEQSVLDEGFHMPFELLVVDLVETDHDTGFDGVSEFVIDCGAEHLHR